MGTVSKTSSFVNLKIQVTPDNLFYIYTEFVSHFHLEKSPYETLGQLIGSFEKPSLCVSLRDFLISV